MTLELHVVSGRRAGARERFDKSVVSVGRHPLSDLRFDPYHDLDVSTRHAELRGIDGVWTIRDQQSTNGTFVNGQRVEGERVVRAGDLITFGVNGPRVEVHIAPPPFPAGTALPPLPPTPPTPMPVVPHRPDEDHAARVAEALEAQTRMLRRVAFIGMAMVLLLVVIGALAWSARR